MTVIYVPVEVTSTKVLEDLPPGSLLHKPRDWAKRGLTGTVLQSPYTLKRYFRVGHEHWDLNKVYDNFFEALVPTIAEEEERVDLRDLDIPADVEVSMDNPILRNMASKAPRSSRYVTGWKEIS